MSAQARIDKAIKWLEAQKESLKRLRNASTRDPEFKEWRQSTLTYIQRIWPGDAKRSGRFRRVPFSPPSSRADRNELRLCFEKGYAEAVKLLEIFIEDIEQNGLPEGEGNGKPPALESALPQDDVPMLDEDEMDLPGDEASEGPGEGSDRPDAKTANGRKRQARKKGGVRKRLKDMLGFDDAETRTDVESETPRPLERPVEEVTAIEHDDERFDEPVQDTPVSAEREVEVEPEAEVQPEKPEPETDPVADDEADASEDDEDFGEFLNASPVFQSASRARRPAAPPAADVSAEPTKQALLEATPAARTFESSVALAIGALAADVERMGVPKSEQEHTRRALLDVAEMLDNGDPSWDGLRGAVDFAMEHPAVARRVLPLLIPYLDRAA